MSNFPPIGDHGLIGDLRTCALVSADGDIDWFCPERYDRPSVFASILDQERGGTFRVWMEGAGPGRQLYMPDTAVLTTDFTGRDGSAEVVDFMPVSTAAGPAGGNRIVRILRGTHGVSTFSVACRPRFDYGRNEEEMASRIQVLRDRHTAKFYVPGSVLQLATDFPLEADGADGADVVGTVVLRPGETATLVLSTGLEDLEGDLAAEAEKLFSATRAYWRNWLRGCTYQGRWTREVHRSAITLKLLTHVETGAPVASPTAALPERIGGERNWDYRYTWIRDGSFTARAFHDLGLHDEAEAFARWISARLRHGPTPDGELLSIMYRVDGGTDLVEEVLPHLTGYQDSAPVRVGNGAADQLQLDIYGEVLYSLADTAYFRSDSGIADVARIADWLADNWDRPDEGVWETRGGRRDFTFSRLMCWTAFDRALAMAPDHHTSKRWVEERDAVARQIEQHGWSESRGAYVQSFGDSALDAALLFMPLVGYLLPEDPRWLSTLALYAMELSTDGLSHRYRSEAFADGLKGDESSFDLCSLLLHIALAHSGDVERGEWEFTKFLDHASPTGLFAEEMTEDRRQLGNFPQAFTHLGVIWAALALDAALDADPARNPRE